MSNIYTIVRELEEIRKRYGDIKITEYSINVNPMTGTIIIHMDVDDLEETKR